MVVRKIVQTVIVAVCCQRSWWNWWFSTAVLLYLSVTVQERDKIVAEG